MCDHQAQNLEQQDPIGFLSFLRRYEQLFHSRWRRIWWTLRASLRLYRKFDSSELEQIQTCFSEGNQDSSQGLMTPRSVHLPK